jgi:CxxC motif-containing protein (DUF1111 family)
VSILNSRVESKTKNDRNSFYRHMLKERSKNLLKNGTLLLLIATVCLSAAVPNLEISTDVTNLGGDLSSDLPGRAAIQVNAPNVTNQERRIKQLTGFGLFHSPFTVNSGLGPHFVNSTCAGCHIENGRGPLRFTRTNESMSTLVLKVGLRGLQPNRAAKDVPGIGEQLLDSATVGPALGSARLKWKKVTGTYADGTRYNLREPILDFKLTGLKTRGIVTSIRMAPPIIGPGLLEAVPDRIIMERHDPADLDNNGISGRINHVIEARTNALKIGRFGFKATHPTVEQQTAAALLHDSGVTNPILPQGIPDEEVELSDSNFELLVLYQKLAGVPKARNQNTAKVIAGKKNFFKLGCEDCHRMTLKTENHIDPELSNQTFHPFTDLLLHDMGRGLADKRAEFSAKGSEWKTAPLWGLGFSRRLTKNRVFYLHDGRARTVEEAILWHGGEAEKSKKAFTELPKQGRDELLTFLDSL